MNFLKKAVLSAVAASIVLCNPYHSMAASLDAGEEAHLIFMREEEKLARDVYLTLGGLYPQATVFLSIVDSEQNHTDTMRDMLYRFDITDPNPDTNNLPESIGVFTGEDYGEYFSGKFGFLTDWGAHSLLEGLHVGAYIEELDMIDIVECPEIIVITDNDVYEGECGLNYTDEQPLINSYNNLLEGSRNHLRAYVRNIEAIIGEGNYVAQIMTQEEVDAILAADPQTGNRNQNQGGGRRGFR